MYVQLRLRTSGRKRDLMMKKKGGVVMTYTYFAQAIVQIETQAIIRYELLLRMWDEAHQQWRLPDTFEISVQEQTRLIVEALKALKIKRVGINLTPKQFHDPAVAAGLVAFVQQTPELQTLTVELTDAPTMEEMLSVGAQLHAAGIRIAIDDVGSDVTDYDLVEQLLPHLDIMKFALQNMRALGQMDNVEAVIAKWRDLAARYHVEFTFEGVETPEDLQLAGRSGVSEAQGYYFNKPVLPATFCKE